MSEQVLIVDDSMTVRMDLAEVFEAAGYVALPRRNVTEAREALAHEALALVVLDVLLPDGDGVELLREIREQPATASLPVLMLSSEAEVKDRIRGLRTGASDYVGKPYDAAHVLSRARELTRGRQAEPAGQRSTILVIDDSPTFREQTRAHLVQAGYDALGASSGEEGLRLAAVQRPRAILVDNQLPGIDGAAVIRRLRLDAALRGTPCVLMTASDDRNAELHALDAGADAFVRKEEEPSVLLAKLAATLRSAGSEQSAARSLADPRRILLVDDSLTYLHGLGATLREDGYEVILAHSGEEALALLALQSVDCVLLDLLMPGIGGQETCKRLKATPVLRDVPLIMLTSLEDRSAMLEGLGSGADDYISKASDLDVLRARIHAQIRRRQFEDENRRIREELLRSELRTHEARAARDAAEERASLSEELSRKNRELEAFCYSVSHDLRTPLRSIDGFAHILAHDYADKLDATAQSHLARVRAAAQRMGEIIDDLLSLSRVSRTELRRERVDLSQLAREIFRALHDKEPERRVSLHAQADLHLDADARLMRLLLENLLDNAFKFSAKRAEARIEVGARARSEELAYFVRDNGAGFDMTYVDTLFAPFRRLHTEDEFPGSGVGLATVRRIAERHGGRAWAEAAVDQGATVYFTIPARRPSPDGARQSDNELEPIDRLGDP